jgi:hypothetical protein
MTSQPSKSALTMNLVVPSACHPKMTGHPS